MTLSVSNINRQELTKVKSVRQSVRSSILCHLHAEHNLFKIQNVSAVVTQHDGHTITQN